MLVVLSVVCTFVVSCGRNDVTDKTESMGDLQQNNEGTTMGDGDEAYVSQYTWTEFEALSVEEKDAFIDMFESAEAFEEWMNRAKQELIEKPWENGGRPVNEYTWAEFEALSVEQKDAFFDAFDSVEAFENWMEEAKNMNAGEIQ